MVCKNILQFAGEIKIDLVVFHFNQEKILLFKM